jgi:hypothetical protein
LEEIATWLEGEDPQADAGTAVSEINLDVLRVMRDMYPCQGWKMYESQSSSHRNARWPSDKTFSIG